jgi:hypothetical protein
MEELVAHLIKHYDEAEEIVVGVGETLENYFKSKGEKFSAEIFCKQFDCILQYSMLQMAVADGKIDSDELLFIKEVTKHSDLVTFINTHYKTKVAWDDILSTSTQTMEKWLKINKEYVDKLAEEFVYGFSMVDFSVEADLEGALCEAAAGVMAVLGYADGNSEEKEKYAAGNSLIVEVLASIRAKLDSANNH